MTGTRLNNQASNFRWYVIPKDAIANPEAPTMAELALAMDITHLIKDVRFEEYAPNGDVIDD